MKENSTEGIIDIIKEKYTRYLNCETDIIGLTIEEAIFIFETYERRNYVTSIVQEACKVILSDYKRVLKENEELKKFHIQDNKHLDFIMKNSITVQKVKDKIDELVKNKNQLDEINRTFRLYTVYDSYDLQANILKELLNKGE